ncbi:hypothetical protein LCGC14_2394110 [marine sediment metagenome]|uniref:Uncharacterized protein n=1 Tax=marine sediment metagenome TaxID=412755 RepID=A0A0F9CJD3_9ZZZZ
MKYIVILCGFLSGCATVGDIEGLGQFGEILRAAETSRILLGGAAQRHNTAPVVNRTMGEVKSLSERIGSTDITTLPNRIQQVKYIIENTRDET